QGAGSHKFALAVDRRQCIACRESNDLVAPDGKECARTDHHCTGANLLRRVECGLDLAFGVCAQDMDLLSDRARCLLHVVNWVSNVGQVGVSSTAIRVAAGTISRSSPSRFAPRTSTNKATPVTLPPGLL